MYKRDNLTKEKSERQKKKQNRYRSALMNFRVTQEEKEKIEQRMKLSGLTKQEFIIQSLMNQKVICIGNVKTFEAMKKQLDTIIHHLQEIKSSDELNENLVESLRMIVELYAGLNEKNAL